jgi:site-specific DNA-methyltransferase (adenine-specific)
VRNIANSIRRFGWQQEAVITADGVLVIGHGRRLAAIQIGCEMPVKVIDKDADELTEEDIRELRIADNKTNESPWDYDLLEEDMAGLDFEGFEFDFTGQETEAEDDREAVDDEWDQPIPEEPKRARKGQIWQLGNHRLMVGDSTEIGDVQLLMDGAQADLFLTDPPYNVDYEGGTDEKLKIENDNMSDSAFEEFLDRAFFCADAVMKPGAAYYIWHADSNGYQFRQAALRTGWQLRQCLIWVKNTFVLGRQDYQWRHEPCLYGWKEGSHHFTDDRTQSTVIDGTQDIRKMSKEQLIDTLEEILGEKTPQTVMYEDKPLRNLLHPTMKPVTLMAKLARNSTKPGETVLDTFGGSGSTMIACEQIGRKCFMMELDARYAEAIIDRWESFTGEKAVLISE